MITKGYRATARDNGVISWLWHWKIATTAMLARKFFPEADPLTAYKRLMAMEKGGRIECILDNKRRNFAWRLTKKMFDAICEDYKDIVVERGFKSENMSHDLIVNAAHVGEWLEHWPEGVEYVTEQSMRRFHPDALPEGLPDIKRHRPDGFWIFGGLKKPRVLALEVELSQKKKYEYHSLGGWYNLWGDKVQGVIWLVASSGMARSIEGRIFEEVRRENKTHHFVLLEDFLNLGWHAPIVRGPKTGTLMGEILDPKFLEHCPEPNLTKFFLDTRKSPRNPSLLSHECLEESFLLDRDLRPKAL